MSTKRRLDFVFVCRQSFDALTGDDPVVRRCEDCALDVTDLDALEGDELETFLAARDREGAELCARLTVGEAEPRPCAEHMRPGTYVGRTEASARRTGRGFARRPGEDFAAAIERATRECDEARAIADAILERARARARRR